MMCASTFVQAQHHSKATCWIHSFNNGTGAKLLSHTEVQQELRKTNSQLFETGWYHIGDMQKYLAIVCPDLRLTEGQPHLGQTQSKLWQDTLNAQQHKGMDFALLSLRPKLTQHYSLRALAQTRTHVVAAVKLKLQDRVKQWYILDSLHPTVVQPLEDIKVSSAFDADVAYITFADQSSDKNGRAATARTVRDLFPKRLSPATTSLNPGCSWPLAPVTQWDGFTRQRMELLLFATSPIVYDRNLLIRVCRASSLQCLEYAKFSPRACSDPCNVHLTLTVVQQIHLQQLERHWEDFRSELHKHTGWRVVKAGKTKPNSRTASRSQDVPPDEPTSGRKTSNGFAVLDNDTECPHTQTCPNDTNTSAQACRNTTVARRNVGTLNTRGLTGRKSAQKVAAICQAMDAHELGVLAVQETRHSNETKPQPLAGYRFYGEEAANGDSHPSGGSGFLVHSSVICRCTYLGKRPHGPDENNQYTPVWLRCKGPDKADTLHIGCVYLPDASRFAQPGGEALFNTAVEQMMHDVDFYDNAILCGDFNSHMTCSKKFPHGPQYGGNKCNKQGRILLQAMAEHNLTCLSAQTAPIQYTYAKGRGRSVIDHILIPEHFPQQQTQCVTVPRDEPEIQACDTDHTIVLANILPQAKTHHHKPARQYKWRRTIFDSLAGRKSFRAEIKRQAQTLEDTLNANIDAQSKPSPTTYLEQQVADLNTIVDNTAQQVCGKAEVVPNVSVPWMAQDKSGRLRKCIKSSRQALLAYKIASACKSTTALDKEHLRTTYETCWAESRDLIRDAQRCHKKHLATQVNKFCAEDLSSNRTARAIDKAAGVQMDRPQISELRMPGTDETHTDHTGKLKCLEAHYAALATPTSKLTQQQAERKKWAADKVNNLAQQREAGPPELDADIESMELKKALQSTDNRKAPGHDKQVPEFFKYGGPEVFDRVKSIFQTVLDTGSIPVAWRQGIVTNLSKPGDPTDCGNYRGITLLPVLDKLFMKIIANRLLNFVKVHDHQYGFVRNKGTTEALFNLIATLEQQKLDHKALYAFFLDIKKAFDTVDQNMLLIKLHRAGVRGKVWNVIKNCYEQARSCVTLEGFFSNFFDIKQGVAQGCPLSPVLFIIFMDDLLHSLHKDCAQAGVTVSFDQRPYVSQSFADDTSALAEGQKHENMQTIITAMHAHSEEWLWNANVMKSHVMAMQMLDVIPMNRSTFQWGSDDLPFADKTKNLGVWINHDLSWNEHISLVKKTGWLKLKKYKQVLQSPQVHLRAKLHTIRTKIIPTLTYAMEVWTPNSQQEWKSVHELTAIIDRALALAITGFKGNKWQTRRCLKMPVIRALLKIPDAVMLLETAHVRFATKIETQHTAACQPADADSNTSELEVDTQIPLTLAIMQSLSPEHPWRKLVTSTKEKVHAFAQQTEIQGTRTTESQTAPDDIKSLLQQLVAQETYKSMKSPGHQTSSQCHTRTRRTQHAAKTDPYKHILAQDSPDSMQATLCALQTAGSHQTAPILAACCGHLLDDLNTEGDAGLCGHCNAPYSQDNCASKQAEQWDRLWHRLAGCHGDEDQQSKLAVYQGSLLEIAATDAEYNWHLQQTFQTIHNADTDPEAAKSTLLHLITDPAGYGQPPHELHAALIALTAAFLQRGPDGGEEASEKPEDKQTSVRGHSQDKYVKPYERAKHKPACRHATIAQRGAESAPRQQGKVTDECSKTMLACQSCEARGGRHETPPTVPPAVALAEAKAAALRPMPFGCA